jgi:hypothetical protein
MIEENVGRRGRVWSEEKTDGGRNLFKLLDGEGAKL